MTFLNSAMLAGLLAVGAPVAIHLLSRPRFRELRWAAMQFLLPSLKKSRRIAHAEDIILMLLRCLVVALLVLIFARAARLVDPAELAKAAGTDTCVLILDQSASMGRTDGFRAAFDVAKAEADRFLAAQPPGSASALFLATDRVRPVVARPTSDLANVRTALASAPLTDAGSDLYPAIKAAVELLKKTPSDRREIVLFTDGQMTAWRQLPAIRTLLAESPQIRLDVRVVGEARGANLAIVSVQPQVAVVAVDQPMRFAVEVANRGATPATGTSVKLAIDNDTPVAEAFIDRLEPGASRVVNLGARFSTPGPHSVTARLPSDSLPSDNQRTFALRILPQLRALVVEGTVPAERVVGDGFFLSRALVPVPADEAGRYFIKATVAGPAELARPALTGYPLVFLSNVARLAPAESQNLRRHVESGGTLVVFPGPATDLEFFNHNADFAPLLPTQLAPSRVPATQSKILGWQSRDYPHPLTALWNDPAAGHLGSVGVSRYFPFLGAADVLESHGVETVVRYANGEPAVLEHTVGRGRVLLFGSAATPGWTTLPLHPAFVPLLLRIAAQASGQIDEGLNLPPGQAFSAPVDADAGDAPVSVIRPGETTRRAAGLVETTAQGAKLRYDDTDQAGVYRLFVGDEARPRALFAVQGNPDESDPATLPANDLAALTSPQPAVAPAAAAPTSPHAPAGARVPGEELWALFALAALVCVLLETALAHYVSRSKI